MLTLGNVYNRPYTNHESLERLLSTEEAIVNYVEDFPEDLVFISGDFNAHSEVARPGRTFDRQDYLMDSIVENLEQFDVVTKPKWNVAKDFFFISHTSASLIDFFSRGFSAIDFTYKDLFIFGHRP